MMANSARMIYTGVTGDIEPRVFQHKRKQGSRHTTTYNMTRLVYAEAHPDALSAIAREKQIKGWLRRRKVALIESINPDWRDLAEDWFESDELLFAGDPPSGRGASAETLRFAQGDGKVGAVGGAAPGSRAASDHDDIPAVKVGA
jgi:putative endonuclease